MPEDRPGDSLPIRRWLPPAAVAALILLAAVTYGCGGTESASPEAGEAQVDVVATTTQIADLVRNVGGSRVAVTQILQPGSDPHGFEPRPSDVMASAAADLVFSNGLELDDWVGQLVSDSGGQAEIVDLSASISSPLEAGEDHGELHDDGHDHGESEIDPHWWQDPLNAASAVSAIRDRLAEADPQGSPEYRRNARTYIGKINRLHRQIARCIDRIPRRQRKLITDHQAFDYFAARYELDVVGTVIPALTTQAQASARDLSRLVDTIEQEGVRAVFPSVSVSPKLAETISRQTGATVENALYGDSLGPADSGAATYLDMMATNALAIVDGLGAGEVRCRLAPGR